MSGSLQIPLTARSAEMPTKLPVGSARELSLMHRLLWTLCVVSAFVPPVPESIVAPVELSFAGVFVLLVILGLARPIRQPVLHLERSAQTAVLLLLGAWLGSAANLLVSHELTLSAYVRGLTPFLGILAFRAGQHFRSSRSATILLFAMVTANLLSAVLGAGRALHEGTLDPADLSNSIHFRSLLDDKFFDALVLSLPVALIGGGMVGRSRVASTFLVLGPVLLLFASLTLMRSGIVIAVLVLLFELAIIGRDRGLWGRFSRRVPVALVLVGLLEVGAFLGTMAGIRIPSALNALGATWERQRHYNNLTGGDDREYRFMEAEVAWERFLEAPLWGHGLGATISVYLDNCSIDVDRSAMRYTHNFFTYTLYTCGTVGILAAACFFQIAIRLVYRVGCNAARSAEPATDMALALLTLAMLVYIQFQSVYRAATYFMMLGLIFGCLAARSSVLGGSSGDQRNAPASKPARRVSLR